MNSSPDNNLPDNNQEDSSNPPSKPWKGSWQQILALVYNVVLLLAVGAAACAVLRHKLPCWFYAVDAVEELVICGLLGCTGGAIYCLMGVYKHACRENDWHDRWLPWYYIRPVVSLVLGIVSYIFLKAGLLVLTSAQPEQTNTFVFYALAFFAGMSVEKFLAKLNEIARTIFGIGKKPKNDDHRP